MFHQWTHVLHNPFSFSKHMCVYFDDTFNSPNNYLWEKPWIEIEIFPHVFIVSKSCLISKQLYFTEKTIFVVDCDLIQELYCDLSILSYVHIYHIARDNINIQSYLHKLITCVDYTFFSRFLVTNIVFGVWNMILCKVREIKKQQIFLLLT